MEHLRWDSEFFGIRVGRIQAGPDLGGAVVTARVEGVECLYIVVPGQSLTFLNDGWKIGARLVDLRLRLSGVIPSVPGGPVRRAEEADLPHLQDLAERLSAESRFRADPRFEPQAVKRMYRIWTRRCFDEGVVIVSDDIAAGFVGARLVNGMTSIDLVYVSPVARGQGYARRLVAAAVQELGTEQAHVTTQVGNVAAQRLYQSLGLRTDSTEAILHLWLD